MRITNHKRNAVESTFKKNKHADWRGDYILHNPSHPGAAHNIYVGSGNCLQRACVTQRGHYRQMLIIESDFEPGQIETILNNMLHACTDWMIDSALLSTHVGLEGKKPSQEAIDATLRALPQIRQQSGLPLDVRRCQQFLSKRVFSLGRNNPTAFGELTSEHEFRLLSGARLAVDQHLTKSRGRYKALCEHLVAESVAVRRGRAWHLACDINVPDARSAAALAGGSSSGWEWRWTDRRTAEPITASLD